MNKFIAKLKAFFTFTELALKSDVDRLESRIKALETQLKVKLTKGGATSTKRSTK